MKSTFSTSRQCIEAPLVEVLLEVLLGDGVPLLTAPRVRVLLHLRVLRLSHALRLLLGLLPRAASGARPCRRLCSIASLCTSSLSQHAALLVILRLFLVLAFQRRLGMVVLYSRAAHVR